MYHGLINILITFRVMQHIKNVIIQKLLMSRLVDKTLLPSISVVCGITFFRPEINFMIESIVQRMLACNYDL